MSQNPFDDEDKIHPFEYHSHKRPSRTYASSKIVPEDGDSYRLVSRVIDQENQYELVKLKDELVFEKSSGKRTEWIAKIFEDDKGLMFVTLQRYEKKTKNPHHSIRFSFTPNELSEFYKFLRVVKILPLKTTQKDQFENVQLEALLSGDDKWFEVLENKRNLVATFVEQRLTERDIVALGYRRQQLEAFENLLSDENYFQLALNKYKRPEAVWQRFFEQNEWIFGYGLDYIFSTGLEKDRMKLEQTVAGSDFTQSGKRVDALMKTRGAISSFSFVEIKTHTTRLIGKEYRGDSYPVSGDLSGAIAQIQKTVHMAVKGLTSKLTSKIEVTTKDGDPTGDIVYLHQPKSFLVVGSLDEFRTEYDQSVNEKKYSSFELFRRNITNPEIITFDELYERAKHIVGNNVESLKSDDDNL